LWLTMSRSSPLIVAAYLRTLVLKPKLYDPLEALKAADCQAPQLLISDVVMPQIGGVDKSAIGVRAL
jgi:hypothetical protein